MDEELPNSGWHLGGWQSAAKAGPVAEGDPGLGQWSWLCWPSDFLCALAGLTSFLHKDTVGGHVDAVAGGPACFECETSEAHVRVRWYKDGAELGGLGQRFSQEDVGTRHRLVVASVTRQDEGTYSCRVGEDSVDFRLRVCGECTASGAWWGGSRSGCIQHLQDHPLGLSFL